MSYMVLLNGIWLGTANIYIANWRHIRVGKYTMGSRDYVNTLPRG